MQWKKILLGEKWQEEYCIKVKIIFKNESIRRFDLHRSVRVKVNDSQVSYRASVRERFIKLMYLWKVERKYACVPVQSTDVQWQNCIFTNFHVLKIVGRIEISCQLNPLPPPPV
jgi:hypothetical protein